jgi:RNA polymerase sigma factor (sigma-70 family)
MTDPQRIGCVAARPAAQAPQRRPHITADELSRLVAGAAQGEERAWQLLVARFSATIRSVAKRHSLSAADQEEVAQRTWLALVEHIETIREPAAIAGWIVTTARHECQRLLVRSRREIPVEEFHDEVADPSSVEDAVASAERREALHRALEVLPPRQRELMRIMLERPALTVSEISVMLGVPKGSIGPTQGRSLARLRRDPHLAQVVAASPRALVGHDLGC